VESPEQFVGKSRLVRFAQANPLTCFFLLSYAWAWTFWLVVPRITDHFAPKFSSDAFDISIFIVGAFGPTAAALITRWLTHRDLKICLLWTGWRSLLLGLGVGLAAFFAVTVLAPSLVLVKAPWNAIHWSALAHWNTYVINYSTLLGGPVNEEPGWRGFALPRLQERYGPIRATLILVPLWAGWHLPLFRMQGWSSASPFQFLLILLGIGFLLTATANLAKFGVLVAIVLHAFFNTSSAMGNAVLQDLPTRSNVMVVYTSVVFVCGTLLGLAILAAQRNSWERNSSFRGSTTLEGVTGGKS
jgi:membrane protease YdiL (CAAX protease family)